MADKVQLPLGAEPVAAGAVVAIIDDDADLRLTLAGLLAENGFTR